MKCGIFSWFGYPLPLPERFNLISKAGFEAVSMWFGPESEWIRTGKGEKIPSRAAECGLFLENAHIPFKDVARIWEPASPEINRIRREYEGAVRYCGRHRIPVMVMHATRSFGPSTPTPAGISFMRELVFVAENEGVKIALENTSHPDILNTLLDEIPGPALGLCYDTSHDLLHPGAQSLLSRWGGRLFATHISDCDGKIDRHKLPKEGVLDWSAFAGKFPRDYKGCLSLEVVAARRNQIPVEDYLKKAFEAITWIRALICPRLAADPEPNQ